MTGLVPGRKLSRSLEAAGMSNSYSLVERAKQILHDRGWSGLVGHASRSVIRNWKEWRFRPYITHQRIAGENLTLRIADQFGETWYTVEHDWTELTWVRDRLVERGGTAVDVGTNHGVTAVLFAKWVGSAGQVVAIDGRAQNVATARENATLNGLSNIRLIHSAVGSRNGTVEFMDQPNGGVLLRPGGARRTVMVPLRTLDDLLGDVKVSLLKIDVEGHELEVLKGAQKTLANAPNLDLEIHCETFADPAGAVKEILERIDRGRYQLHWQLTFDGAPVPDSTATTPDLVAQHGNVHLFAQRRDG